jgi:type II secretory pathway component PulM
MNLNPREKLLLTGAILILTPLIIFQFVLNPIRDYQDRQSSWIKNLESKEAQLRLLGQELQYLNRANQTRSASLSRRVDAILRKVRLKTRSRTVVETSPPGGGQRLVLKLDKANLTELANLIYRIENAKPGILVENVDINPSYQNKNLFRISAALSSQ